MVAGCKQTLQTACRHRCFEFQAIWRTRAGILNVTLTYYFEYLLLV